MSRGSTSQGSGTGKKVAVAIGGGAVTLAGLALLPLPGPGFIVVAGGLAILASQFRWAARPLQYARRKAQQGIDQVADSNLSAAFAVVCAAVVLGTGVLVLAGVHIPFVSPLSAVLLVLSGLFAAGLVVWARRRGGRRSAAAPSSSRVDA